LLCLHTNLSKKYTERLERHIQRRRITDRENKQRRSGQKEFTGIRERMKRKAGAKNEKEKRKKRDVN
jgi:hypothetical protein